MTDHSELSEIEIRVRALESILTEKGYIDPAAVDAITETYETRIGPRNGARVVAKAWLDDGFAAWLRTDTTAAVRSLGFHGRSGEHIRAVANTPTEHNLVVCTLCSCYPWTVLGLPPVWYKSAPYRSRAVIDPRGVLADFGVTLAPDDAHPGLGFDVGDALSGGAHAARRHRRLDRGTTGRTGHPGLHDRYRIRPRPRSGGVRMNGVHDMGGLMDFGPVGEEPNEPTFHADWEKRAFGLVIAMGATREWTGDGGRFAREILAGPLPVVELLRDLVRGTTEAAPADGPRHRG